MNEPMHILVNAIPLMGLVTGISRYLRALYQEMERMPGVRVSYFTGADVVRDMPSPARPDRWIKTTGLIWKLPDPLVFLMRSARWLVQEHRLGKALRRGRYDIYHETAYFPSRMKGIPMILSVYDLSLVTFRDHHPRERVWFYNAFLPRRLRYASHILTISRFVQSEIQTIMKVSPERISAVLLAPDPLFTPRDPERTRRVQKTYHLPDTYFLFVGSLEPRKNLNLIIQAMTGRDQTLPLVLAGWDGWGDKAWKQEMRTAGLADRVFMTGYVDDETLACLYSGARALIYPSLYEGFGLPVLEAMACGCPVICSHAASLPEAAGDAGLLIDPHDPEDLARAMDRISHDPDLRQTMAKKGLEWAGRFSWRKTARETLSVFDDLMHVSQTR